MKIEAPRIRYVLEQSLTAEEAKSARISQLLRELEEQKQRLQSMQQECGYQIYALREALK